MSFIWRSNVRLGTPRPKDASLKVFDSPVSSLNIASLSSQSVYADLLLLEPLVYSVAQRNTWRLRESSANGAPLTSSNTVRELMALLIMRVGTWYFWQALRTLRLSRRIATTASRKLSGS